MRAVLALVWLLLAWPASAEQLRKCVSEKGAVSYQHESCAVGFREAGVVDYTPEPVRQQVAQPRVYTRAPRQPGPSRRSAPAGHVIPIDNASASCEAAKQSRKSLLDKAGLSRTYEFLSRLDEMVRNACK